MKNIKVKPGHYTSALMVFTEEMYNSTRHIFVNDPKNKTLFLKEEKAWIKLGKPKRPLVGIGGWVYNSNEPSQSHVETNIYAPPIESLNKLISKPTNVLKLSESTVHEMTHDKYLGPRDYIVLEVGEFLEPIIIELYMKFKKDIKIYKPINEVDFYQIN